MRYELADYEWIAIKPCCRTSRVAFLGWTSHGRQATL